MQEKRANAVGAALLAFLLLVMGGCSFQDRRADASGVEFVMDTVMEQQWYGPDAKTAYDTVAKFLRELENTLSLYRVDSEISRLNAAAGRKAVKLSHETYLLLKQAAAYCAQSDGLFDVTIAPLMTLWDITGETPTVPEAEEISTVRALVDYRMLQLNDREETAMLMKSGMAVDLGAVAKGYAAGRIPKLVEGMDVQGFVSIGGNIVVCGKKPSGKDFVMGVRDPRGERSDYVLTVTLDGYTMATTGDYERYFIENGVRYHHVLDPFTGYPRETDLMQVTVIAKDGALADYLSTYLFMVGSKEIENYLEEDDYWLIAIDKDQAIYLSDGLRERVKLNQKQAGYHLVS